VTQLSTKFRVERSSLDAAAATSKTSGLVQEIPSSIPAEISHRSVSIFDRFAFQLTDMESP
jgi:hypothetical protein